MRALRRCFASVVVLSAFLACGGSEFTAADETAGAAGAAGAGGGSGGAGGGVAGGGSGGTQGGSSGSSGQAGQSGGGQSGGGQSGGAGASGAGGAGAGGAGAGGAGAGGAGAGAGGAGAGGASGGAGAGGAGAGGASGGAGTGGAGAGGAGAGGAGAGGAGAGGAGAGGAGTGGTGGSPDATTCPKNPPGNGDPCTGVLECEYGDDLRLSCRTRAVCEGGKFALTAPKCPTLPGAGEAPCPADLGASGSVCVAGGTLCNMHNGAFCECGCFGGGLCGAVNKWFCLGPPQGCPLYAPDVGQPCDGPSGQKCAYGACGSATRGARVCSGGYWVEGKPDPCPQ